MQRLLNCGIITKEELFLPISWNLLVPEGWDIEYTLPPLDIEMQDSATPAPSPVPARPSTRSSSNADDLVEIPSLSAVSQPAPALPLIFSDLNFNNSTCGVIEQVLLNYDTLKHFEINDNNHHYVTALRVLTLAWPSALPNILATQFVAATDGIGNGNVTRNDLAGLMAHIQPRYTTSGRNLEALGATVNGWKLALSLSVPESLRFHYPMNNSILEWFYPKDISSLTTLPPTRPKPWIVGNRVTDAFMAEVRGAMESLNISSSRVRQFLNLSWYLCFQTSAPPSFMLSTATYRIGTSRLDALDQAIALEEIRSYLEDNPYSSWYLGTDDSDKFYGQAHVVLVVVNCKTYFITIGPGIGKKAEKQAMLDIDLINGLKLDWNRFGGFVADHAAESEFNALIKKLMETEIRLMDWELDDLEDAIDEPTVSTLLGNDWQDDRMIDHEMPMDEQLIALKRSLTIAEAREFQRHLKLKQKKIPFQGDNFHKCNNVWEYLSEAIFGKNPGALVEGCPMHHVQILYDLRYLYEHKKSNMAALANAFMEMTGAHSRMPKGWGMARWGVLGPTAESFFNHFESTLGNR
jgi:hypothetical protein